MEALDKTFSINDVVYRTNDDAFAVLELIMPGDLRIVKAFMELGKNADFIEKVSVPPAEGG